MNEYLIILILIRIFSISIKEIPRLKTYLEAIISLLYY